MNSQINPQLITPSLSLTVENKLNKGFKNKGFLKGNEWESL